MQYLAGAYFQPPGTFRVPPKTLQIFGSQQREKKVCSGGETVSGFSAMFCVGCFTQAYTYSNQIHCRDSEKRYKMDGTADQSSGHGDYSNYYPSNYYYGQQQQPVCSKLLLLYKCLTLLCIIWSFCLATELEFWLQPVWQLLLSTAILNCCFTLFCQWLSIFALW